MTPIEFALWMNGAMGVLDGPPTEAQWAAIKSQLSETIGGIVAKRLLEGAEEAFLIRQKQLRDEAEKESYIAMLQQKQAANTHALTAKMQTLGYSHPAGSTLIRSTDGMEVLNTAGAGSLVTKRTP